MKQQYILIWCLCTLFVVLSCRKDFEEIKTHYQEMRQYPPFKALDDWLLKNGKRGFDNIKRVNKPEGFFGSASIGMPTKNLSIYYVEGEAHLPWGTFAHELIHILQMDVHGIQPNNRERISELKGYFELECAMIFDILRYVEMKGDVKCDWRTENNSAWFGNTFSRSFQSREFEDYQNWLSKKTQGASQYPTNISREDIKKWANVFANGQGSYSTSRSGLVYDEATNYEPKAINKFFEIIQKQ